VLDRDGAGRACEPLPYKWYRGRKMKVTYPLMGDPFTLCLFSQSIDETIKEEELKKKKQISINGSKNYYFARNISQCPV